MSVDPVSLIAHTPQSDHEMAYVRAMYPRSVARGDQSSTATACERDGIRSHPAVRGRGRRHAGTVVVYGLGLGMGESVGLEQRVDLDGWVGIVQRPRIVVDGCVPQRAVLCLRVVPVALGEGFFERPRLYVERRTGWTVGPLEVNRASAGT